MLDKTNKRDGIAIGLIMFSWLAVSQPASADMLKYLGPAFGGYVSTSGLSNTPTPPSPVTGSPSTGAVSMLNLTAGGSFAAWCVDIYHWLNSSSTGSSYTLTQGTNFYSSSPRGAQIVTDLERLASQYLASVNTKAESGAFQLAMWEIVYENSGTYGLGSGNFRVASASDGARSMANTWLAGLGNGTPTMTLSVWASSSSQDLAVFTSAIPEPEIYAMLAVGLGLLGFVGKKRRKALAGA
jgi:hypothetical protein